MSVLLKIALSDIFFKFRFLLYYLFFPHRSGPTAPTRVSAPTGTQFANRGCHTLATDAVAAPCVPDRMATRATESPYVTREKGWFASTTTTTARQEYAEVGRG